MEVTHSKGRYPARYGIAQERPPPCSTLSPMRRGSQLHVPSTKGGTHKVKVNSRSLSGHSSEKENARLNLQGKVGLGEMKRDGEEHLQIHKHQVMEL